ncbi:MAG: response regulator [Gallionella sp.]|nr:response regulator [Gallionella sp.]
MTKTVLIVDDSASLRQLVSTVLGRAGYELIEAVDGGDALGKLKGRNVHLIISDVNMPNMDGLTFVKNVKNLTNHKFTPIVMLSSNSIDALHHVAREAGVKAWMAKPFSTDKLLGMVARFVQP